MESLKTSLEAVLSTIQKLPEKDSLVIFLFVRNVVEAVEAYLACGQPFDIDTLLSECCLGFQQADDVLVQKKDECIQVDTVLADKITQSYQLIKKKLLTDKNESEPSKEKGSTDESYYVSLPPEEGAGDPPQTVLECSDPSVLQAFLEEGGKLPSYLPPGTQIIIETEDGRTEVLENPAINEEQKAVEAIQSEEVGDVGGGETELSEAGGDETGGNIPVFVMTEEGEMLISPDQMENLPELKQQIQEAEEGGSLQGEKRKIEDEIPRLETKKLKMEDFGDNEVETDTSFEQPGKYTKTSGGLFQCDKCFQCFSHEHSLHRHYRAQHLQMKWTCDTCGRDFTRADSLVNHKKKGSCFKGPGHPKRDNNLTMPLENEPFVKGQGYICITCDMYFKTGAQLRKHQDKCHNTEKHACNDCGKWFSRGDLLAKHRDENQCVSQPEGTSEAGDSADNVPEAGSTEAGNKQEIKKEVKTPGRRISKPQDDLYLCQECGQCLTSKSALQVHMRKHTGIVPFKCQFCGHGTNSRTNLLRHLENIHGVSKDDSHIKLDLRDYSKNEDDESNDGTELCDGEHNTPVMYANVVGNGIAHEYVVTDPSYTINDQFVHNTVAPSMAGQQPTINYIANSSIPSVTVAPSMASTVNYIENSSLPTVTVAPSMADTINYIDNSSIPSVTVAPSMAGTINYIDNSSLPSVTVAPSMAGTINYIDNSSIPTVTDTATLPSSQTFPTSMASNLTDISIAMEMDHSVTRTVDPGNTIDPHMSGSGDPGITTIEQGMSETIDAGITNTNVAENIDIGGYIDTGGGALEVIEGMPVEQGMTIAIDQGVAIEVDYKPTTKVTNSKSALLNVDIAPVKGYLPEELPEQHFLQPSIKPQGQRGRPRSCAYLSDPVCPMCNKQFHNHSNLTVHMRSHTKELPFECHICQKKFATKANMTRHIQTTHEGRKDWECDICQKRFTEKKTMVNHKRTTHEGERPYECEVCKKSFAQRSTLNSHMSTHREGDPDHPCSVCDKRFLQKFQLHAHIRLHKETDLQCHLCELRFLNKTDLRRHLKNYHNEIVEEEVKCDLCQEMFDTKEEFTQHLNAKHTKAKGFSCTICDNVSFYSNKSLQRHMKNEHPDVGDDSPEKSGDVSMESSQQLTTDGSLNSSPVDTPSSSPSKSKKVTVKFPRVVLSMNKEAVVDKDISTPSSEEKSTKVVEVITVKVKDEPVSSPRTRTPLRQARLKHKIVSK